MITREQDYSEVRRLLNFPKDQWPSPDIIVSNLIRAEQYMLNCQNGMNQGWAVASTSVDSIIGTSDYELEPEAGATFGKALFAYRVLDNSTGILPVPFTDFMSEFSNQRYEFWIAPAVSGAIPGIFGEKLAFYRVGSTVKMRIYPIPDAVRTYQIEYGQGALDWTTFAWSDIPALPEWSHFRQLHAAIATIKACEWDGYSMMDNAAYRKELREDLGGQYALQNAEFQPYIRRTQTGPSIGHVGSFFN